MGELAPGVYQGGPIEPRDGHAVAVLFVSTVSPGAQALLGELFGQRWHVPGVDVVVVSGSITPTPEDANWAAKASEAGVRYVSSNQLHRLYAVSALPYLGLIDRRGHLVEKGVISSVQQLHYVLRHQLYPSESQVAS